MSNSTETSRERIDMQDLSSLVAGDQIPGARDYQEDAFRIIESRQGESDALLLVLADGMGGHIGGARASSLVVETVATHFEKAGGDIRTRLRESLDAANATIVEATKEDPSYTGMGCTLLICLITDNELHWLSVGDSPLWLFRENKIERLNADHSMRPVLESLLESGQISAEELDKDPRINQLRSVVMGEDIRLVDQNEAALTPGAGDQIILASDGLETLTIEEIGTVCGEHGIPAEAVAALLDAIKARQRAGQDNATAVIYRHTGVTHRETRSNRRFLRRLFAWR